ncbi:molybdopterin-binding protein [Nocardioides sp. AN3]
MRLRWSEARQAAYDAVDPLAVTTVRIEQALGRRLAHPLVAVDHLPRFDNAAMDGYAVAGPGPWHLRGTTLAGEPGTGLALEHGEAWAVATGAPVPAGTRSVLPIEDAEVTTPAPGRVVVDGRIDDERHVRLRGEEAVPGEKLISAGAHVTPQVVALAAAVGVTQMTVRAVPCVTALVTGDEFGDGPGQVHDAIGPALPGWVAWAGGTLGGLTWLPDGASDLRTALTSATGDLVVVTGSSSVGPEDHLRPLLGELDARPVVDGVRCRPGSLTGLWLLADGRLVAALPGNPFAALVAFVTVVAPALLALRGDDLPMLSAVAADLPPHRSDDRLAPVRLTEAGPVALGHDRSGMLRGVAEADALAVIPSEGGPVLIQPLPI